MSHKPPTSSNGNIPKSALTPPLHMVCGSDFKSSLQLLGCYWWEGGCHLLIPLDFQAKFFFHAVGVGALYQPAITLFSHGDILRVWPHRH